MVYSISQIKSTINSVFEENGYYLPVNLLSEDSDIDITEYNMSSLDFISIVIGLEDAFELNIPDESISSELFKSFNGLAEYIQALKEPADSSYD